MMVMMGSGSGHGQFLGGQILSTMLGAVAGTYYSTVGLGAGGWGARAVPGFLAPCCECGRGHIQCGWAAVPCSLPSYPLVCLCPSVCLFHSGEGRERRGGVGGHTLWRANTLSLALALLSRASRAEGFGYHCSAPVR